MMVFSLIDIAMAYRKVKVDLFYSGNPCRLALAEFEKNIAKNIAQLKKVLDNNDLEFIFSCCQGYFLTPKKIDFDKKKNPDNVIFSNQHKLNSPEKITECSLRLIADVPIFFHIITTLWIHFIGEKFDAKLSENSYGNRIRRHRDGEPNLNALGSFNPYLIHYQKWRDTGLKVIRDGLEKNKDIVAITADFTAFYHNVSPDFISNIDWQKRLGVELNNDEQEFTKLVVDMLKKWAENTPLKKGLPVGCSISAVIANAALAELDLDIEHEIAPLYYGRYVDDIIIVMENTNHFSSASQVWDWICKRVNCLKPPTESDGRANESRISLETDYLPKGELFFEQSKTKVFLLEYPSGLGLLDSLEHQIKVRSSEWRALPELPNDTRIASMLLAACNKSGEDADNLRKADSLSIRRAIFAMKLRDFEAYCRNLDHQCWAAQRRAFLRTIAEYFTDLSSYFDLFRYFPRIIAIATECREYDLLLEILNKIIKIYEIISALPDIPEQDQTANAIKFVISGKKIEPQLWKDQIKFLQEYIITGLREIFIATYKFDYSNLSETLKKIIELLKITHPDKNTYYGLLGNDLAYLPFRCFYLYKEMFFSREDKIEGTIVYFKSCPNFYTTKNFEALIEISQKSPNWEKLKGAPLAWIFPTRPFNITELYFISPSPFKNSESFMNYLITSRGYAKHTAGMPSLDRFKEDEKSEIKNIYSIQNKNESSKKTIALVSWKTYEKSWTAAACQKIDPDYSRYDRITHLLNQILHSHSPIDYVVFPELSIPPRWFLGLALKLKTSGISLIAGVEYIHRDKTMDNPNSVYNQVWCSLVHDGLGFHQSVIFKHSKDLPAIHEKQELDDIANATLVSEIPQHTCDIVKHGNFYFGILICSELTDINNRAKLRGLVDAIFVPEWNSDIEMFGSLIEAAAYDVHAYIIQCNDRQYGDTRIRVPAKNHYSRDIVKVKGGEEDFFVVGKLDIYKLRAFQSFQISPTGMDVPFKPVPAGFRIAEYRKVLPEIKP